MTVDTDTAPVPRADRPPARHLPPAARRRPSSALTDDAVAITFEVPAGPARRLRVHPGPAPDRAHRGRRRRGAPQLLDLRARHQRPAAHRGQAPRRRRLLRARDERAAGRRRGRRHDADRPLLHRAGPRAGQALLRRRRRQRHHAGALDRGDRARGGAREHGHPRLRQPDDGVGDVPRRARRPQGPLPDAVPGAARAVPRAAGGRAVLRAHRRRPDPAAARDASSR